MHTTKNLRVVDTTVLQSPDEIAQEIPLSPRAAAIVFRARGEIEAVLHGRDRRKLVIVGPCSVHDPDAALENTRFWAPLSLTPEQKHSIEDPIEMEAAADALPIEQVAKRWIVASDPDEAVEKVKAYIDAGLNHLVFHAPGHDQKRFLELFERDLAPRLRALRRGFGSRHSGKLEHRRPPLFRKAC